MSRSVPVGQPFNAGAYFATGLTHVGVEVQLRPAGTVLVARTEAGVAEVSSAAGGALGLYNRQFSAIGSACEAWLLWDDNLGHYQEEELIVEVGTTPPGFILGADPGVVTIDGVSTLSAFKIKRNDTLPAFEVKLRRSSGATPPLTSDSNVYLNLRPVADAPNFAASTDLKHLAMTIINAGDAHVIYQWAEADTATAGSYKAEVEVNYPDGNIETFPAASEIDVTIRPDLDPGIDP